MEVLKFDESKAFAGLVAERAAHASDVLAPDENAEMRDLLFAGKEDRDHFAQVAGGFVLLAGAVSGEPLWRWTSARKLHLLHEIPWSETGPSLRRYFEVFAKVAHALRPPQAPAAAAISVGAEPADRFERTHAPAPPRDARIGGLGPMPAAAFSVSTTPGAAAPAQPAPARESVVIPADDLAALARAPSLAAFQQMSPEERRAHAAAFGMGGNDELRAALKSGAPLAEAAPDDVGEAENLAIDETVDGEKIAGEVRVAVPKGKRK